MNRLRIALVGAGHLGKIHGRLLQQVSGAELVAVADPDEAAGETLAQQLGVPAFTHHHELIDLCDAAVIASPTRFHAEIGRDLVSAGKHLLVEKPLATDAEDALELARLATARRVTLQVGHVERFNPAWTAAGDQLQRAKFIEAVRASRFPGRCLDVGVVMDLMIHHLDLVLSLTEASVCDVQASGLALITDNEDLAEARVTFECGLVAQFKASRVSPLATRQLQAFGEQGFTEIDFAAPAVTVVRPHQDLSDRSFDLDEVSDNPLAFSEQLFRDYLPVEAIEIEPRNAILDELHDFVLSVQTGVAPTVSGAAGARAVELADSILAAIDQRSWSASNAPSQQGPFAIPQETIEAASRRIHTARRAA